MKLTRKHLPEICAVTLLVAAALVTGAQGQEAVVANAGQSSQVYAPGRYVGSTIIPAKGTNKLGVIVDVGDLTDPEVCIRDGLEFSSDGVTWQLLRSSNRCGVVGGFKDKQGQPRSAFGSYSHGLDIGRFVYRPTIEISGKSVRTATSVTMAEIQ